jgi:molecular chaperone DnaK (HSP70)
MQDCIGNGRYTFIENFKLALDPSSGYTLPEGFTALQVITDYLRFLKNFTLEKLAAAYGGNRFHHSLLQWCMTVPAMWDDQQKGIMRNAAVGAGIIEEEDSDRLLMILEPEAAGLHAHVNNVVDMEEGDVFMVIDAGGGTVDITTHQVAMPEHWYRKWK